MVRRVIGQEELFGTDRQGPTELDTRKNLSLRGEM